MKRKKIGATLIVVVTIFSAILITSAAVITMTVGDYRMKQAQSNKTHNLYGADSGLDVAYDIMVADFDEAGNYAGFKVQQLKAGKSQYEENQTKYNNLVEEDQLLESQNPGQTPEDYEKQRKRIQNNKNILINAEFQRSFKLFLNSNWAKSNSGEYQPNQLNNIIKSEDVANIQYVAQINSTGTENDTNSVDINKNIVEQNFFYKYVDIKGSPDIAIEFSEESLTNDVIDVQTGGTATPNNYKNIQEVRVDIISKFKTKDTDSGAKVVGQNESTLKSTYKIIIPNYDDIYFIDQEYKPYIYDVYKDKGITVFGNMQVKDMATSSLTVNGDVFVFANKDTVVNSTSGSIAEDHISSTKIIDKYQGGISLDGNSANKTKILFNNNVVTGGTFNIQKNVDTKITDDLYALNVYAGKQNGGIGDHSSLSIGNSMILDNDLTVKATDTNINMAKFYGINDKHVKDNGDGEKARNSSSIIVNTYKNDTNVNKSSVNISDEAYIMGVAYIDTSEPYQTGESIGVKANYKAYSDQASKDKDNNLNFTFGLNTPLYLINGKVNNNGTVDPNVSIEDKTKHFVNYWEEDANKSNLENGGVQLPSNISNIHSVGAIVYKDGEETKVGGSNYSLDTTETKILELRRQYALKVYNLGSKVIDSNNSGETEENFLDELYTAPNNRETTINKFMTLDNITDDETKKTITNEQNIGVFNKESTNTVVIKGENSTYVSKDTDIVLNADSGTLSAFIATKGDVVIDGEVEFKGNIIAEGSLIIQGSGDKTISYNEDVAKSIQRKVPDIFAKVFKLGGSIEGTTNPDESNLKIDYDLGKFLKSLLWKIMK